MKGCYSAVFTHAGLNETSHLQHITTTTTTRIQHKKSELNTQKKNSSRAKEKEKKNFVFCPDHIRVVLYKKMIRIKKLKIHIKVILLEFCVIIMYIVCHLF